MNQFDLAVKRARRHRRQMLLLASSSLVLLLVIVLAVILMLKVTRVVVLPEEARPTSVVSLKAGIGVIVNSTIYAFSGHRVVSASAGGYESESVSIPPEHSGPLEITLVELPATLIATTNADNNNTRWYIDGTLEAVSASFNKSMNAGVYQISADNPYYQVSSQEVQLHRAGTKELRFDLKPVSGSLEIRSNPGGLSVMLNGEIRNSTPQRYELPGGEHKVVINAENFERIEDVVKITREYPDAKREYLLKPKQASLSFTLKPGGGLLLVNGKKITNPSSVSINASSRNKISYMKDGYYPRSYDLLLEPGEHRNETISLAMEMGDVKIISNPPAEVFIDGVKQGATPLTLTLQAIKQEISIQKENFRTVKKVISPSSKETSKITITLVDSNTAKLNEAKKVYTNSMGIELKLFFPSRFTMGAARHEKGQRANEFLQDVILRKPFYASLKEITVNQYSKYKPVENKGKHGNYPVTSVSWLDVAMYCNWLSSVENLKPFYVFKGGRLSGFNPDASGYRLLSEAEWEWLARKSGRKKQTVFTWGDQTVIPPTAGNIADESARNTVSVYVPDYNDGNEQLAAVGSYAADSAGLYDMTGNAKEWVNDYYSLVPPSDTRPLMDPLGDRKGIDHVIKGSSWRSGTLTELRASFREGGSAGSSDVGFRIGRYL